MIFGLDNRIVSDTIGGVIDTINHAPSLDAAQKREIFHNPAARLLRPSAQRTRWPITARHHGLDGQAWRVAEAAIAFTGLIASPAYGVR